MADDKKNPSIAPTSELQAAYDDLKSFFTFKENQSLDVLLGKTDPKAADVTIDSKTGATTTLLAPDGAFFTVQLFSDNLLKDVTINDLQTYTSIAGNLNEEAIKVDLLRFINYNSDLTTDFSSKIKAQEKIRSGSIEILRNQEETLGKEQEVLEKELADLYKSTSSEEIKQIAKEKIDKKAEDLRIAFNNTFSEIRRLEAIKNIQFLIAVNKQPTIPDRLRDPHVSLYRYKNPYISVETAASEYCNVFFNGIDSINMSLCVPYLRINVIDRFSKLGNKYPKLSLVSFLKQSDNKDDNDKIFFNAKPVLLDEKSIIGKKIRSGKASGMEAFLSPATLLPDPTDVLSNPRRLDTTVPLMTLDGLGINIESYGIALLSKKTADLTITLHDRSRLNDISTLVSPSNFSSLYFEIEWGWVHPHASAEAANPVARYLNALRYTEIFTPVSYTMNMQGTGAMSINIRLFGGMSNDAIGTSVLTGKYVTRSMALNYLDRFIKATVDALPKVDSKSPASITPIKSLLISKDLVGNMVPRSFIEKIIDFADTESVIDTDDVTSLLDDLDSDLKSQKIVKGKDIHYALATSLKNMNVSGFAQENFERIKGKYDVKSENINDYTSVGAFLTQYIGMPLASTGLYDEVQIHTFKFNDSAGSFLAGKPISDAALSIADLLGNEDDSTSLYQNDSTANALARLGRVLNNPLTTAYGIFDKQPYTAKTPEAKSAEPQSASGDESSKVITIPEGITIPNIKYLLRCVPAKIMNIDASVGRNSKLIAQVFVYDSNASCNESSIVKAYEYLRNSGNNELDAMSIDKAKRLNKIAFPSITYGSVNSVVESISVSTDTNGAIATQNIIEFGKTIINSSDKSNDSVNLPELTLLPVSITVGMLGMPVLERGQSIYLDLGTGTTLDAVYYVTSLRHDFKGNKFSTSMTLTPKGQGTLRGTESIIEDYKKRLQKTQNKIPVAESPNTGPKETASTRGRPPSRKDSYNLS